MLFFSVPADHSLRSVEPERRHLRAWFAVLFAEYDGYPTRMLQASRLTVVFGPLVLISVVSALLGLPLTALIAAQGLSGEILTKMFGMTFGAIALGLALVYGAC